MTPSRIHRLTLTHFRNYRAASISARGDVVALEVPLQAGESVEPGTLSQRALDAATELVIGLFRAGFRRL